MEIQIAELKKWSCLICFSGIFDMLHLVVWCA